MNPFVDGVHDSIIRLIVPAHIICIRYARMKIHPMKDSYEHDSMAESIVKAQRSKKGIVDDSLINQIETYVAEKYKDATDAIKTKWLEIFTFMTKWQGIDESIYDYYLRMQWLFYTIDSLKIKTDQYSEKLSKHGMVASYTRANGTLKISVNGADILDLDPVGAKVLCLSNLMSDLHSHQVVLPEQREDKIELSINAGSFSELKVLSVFPFGKFRSVIGRLGNDLGIESYESYNSGTASYSANQEMGIMADNVLNNTGIDTDVGGNNFVVEDINKFIIGVRVGWKSLHGLVYPTAGGFQQADDHGFGVFTYSVIDQMLDLSESRRRVLASLSWVEGSFDSINTYDHSNRLSWGISHWISNLGDTLDGELNHLLAYLYKECTAEFDSAFGKYGFSVWFDPDNIAVYGQRPRGYLPFKNPTILFPECHGAHLRGSLFSRRDAPWRNRRSIYSAWVFRKAGLEPAIQRGQIKLLNYRMSAVCPLGKPSERDVAIATSNSINPGDLLDRTSRIDACCREKNISLSDVPGSFQE